MCQYDEFRALKRFGSLDGLRAIAILGVIWHHGPGRVAGLQLLRSGLQGVHLFFAISGFLITTLLLRERAANGGISLRRFYARRALRIFPLYYAVLLLYILLTFVTDRHAPEFWHNLRYFFTYTANWFVPAHAVFAFSWSLSTEEQFYCAWPWCERYLPGKWPIAAMALLLSVILPIQAGWFPAWIPHGAFVRTVGEHIALPICFGVLLAHLLHERRGYEAAYFWLGRRWSPVAAFLIAAIALQMHAAPLVTAVAWAMVVGACVMRERHWLTPVLASSPFVKLGEVSYGAYLLHGLAYNAVEVVGNRLHLDRHGVPEFVATACLTMVLARLSYRYYETFFLGLKKHFEPAPAQRAASFAGVAG